MPKFKMPPSMNGDNMFSFKCPSTGRMCSYAICQHTVYAYKEKRLTGFDDCREAIDRRECRAIKMMIAEKKAGKALYFESYRKTLEAREEAAERIKEQNAKPARRFGPRIIAPSRAASNEDRINQKQAENRLTKPAQSRKTSVEQDSSNMFAEVVNALSKTEA